MAANVLALPAVALFLTFLLGRVVRRVYFHPLSRIPGPKIAAVTIWWEAWVDFFYGQGAQFHFELKRLHERYGPIVRVGPSEVHIDDSKYMKTLFGGPGSIRDKHPSLAHILGNELGTFGTVKHHVHRMRRSAVSPFFSKRLLKTFEPRIFAGVENLSSLLQQKCETGDLIDVRVTFLAWSTDSLTSYIFDKPTNMLSDELKAKEWWAMYDNLRVLYPLLKPCLWIASVALELPIWLVALVLPNLVPLLHCYADMRAQAKEKCDEQEQMSVAMKKSNAASDQPNVFRQILASSLPASEKNYQRIAHDGFEVLAAGSITFSRVMACAMFHLLDNPTIRNQLQEEAQRLMPDRSIIPSIKVSESSPIVTAIVKEALRITQIVTFRTPIVAPEDDLYYNGYTLPAGTAVSMTLASALADPTVYPEPKKFLPERWMNPEKVTPEMNHYFVPYGIGNRICLGSNFSNASLATAFVVLFRRFDFELVDTVRERDVDNCRAWFIGEPAADSPGYFIKVTKVRD